MLPARWITAHVKEHGREHGDQVVRGDLSIDSRRHQAPVLQERHEARADCQLEEEDQQVDADQGDGGVRPAAGLYFVADNGEHDRHCIAKVGRPLERSRAVRAAAPSDQPLPAPTGRANLDGARRVTHAKCSEPDFDARQTEGEQRCRRSPPRGRRLIMIVVVAVLVLAGLFAVVGLLRQSGGGSSSGSSGASFSTCDSAPPTRTATLGGEKVAAAPSPRRPAQASGGSAGHSSSIDINAAVPPGTGRFLVRTGELDLLLARGTLNRTVQQVTSLTSAFGGYILSSAVG